MITTNIITASFSGTDNRMTTTRGLYQYDYGQVLRFDGLDLPQAYEVHFSDKPYSGEATTQIGNADGVTIPDTYLLKSGYVYAWVYLHTGEDDGETRYTVKIPVAGRSKTIPAQPDPVQQDAITEAIAALNRAVEQTAEDVVAAAESAQESERQAGLSADSAQASADSAAASEASAQESERQAGLSANSAAESARYAQASAQSAQESAASASASAASAEDAAESADKAEQAAATGGWLCFEIIEGDLWLERTPTISTDFYLDNGDLIMEAVV